MKIRISRRVGQHLEGSGLVQQPTVQWSSDPNIAAAATRLRTKYLSAPSRRDGSCTLELDAFEANVLERNVRSMAAGAADNTWDSDGRADLAAARGALKQLEAAR